MKPWEEEWEAVQRSHGKWHLHCVEGQEEEATFWGDDDAGRCRLAAAAPEMARLLLRYAEGVGPSADGDCPECDEPVRHRHKAKCALLAVLNKAGVIPQTEERSES